MPYNLFHLSYGAIEHGYVCLGALAQSRRVQEGVGCLLATPMKMPKPCFAAGAAAAFAFALLAQASFTGRWLAEITTPNGDKRETTFFLTQSGDRLSGAVLNGYRMQNISEGKVTGNEAAWTVVARFGQQERRIEYHARLQGDRLTVTMPGFGRAAAPRRPTT